MAVPSAQSRVFALAILASLVLPAMGAAAPIPFRIDRTSADPEAYTFSGTGTLEFASNATGPTSDPADIGALSLRIATLGTVYPEDGVAIPTTHVFVFDAPDISAVTGLAAAAGGGLAGSIDFVGVFSEGGGLVFMDSVTLDFDAGLASADCYYSGSPVAECILGGGSSSGVRAILSAGVVPVPLPIPLPAALPLLALSLGGLGLAFRPRRI